MVKCNVYKRNFLCDKIVVSSRQVTLWIKAMKNLQFTKHMKFSIIYVLCYECVYLLGLCKKKMYFKLFAVI